MTHKASIGLAAAIGPAPACRSGSICRPLRSRQGSHLGDVVQLFFHAILISCEVVNTEWIAITGRELAIRRQETSPEDVRAE
jgi:hypothetical protein